MLKPPAAGEAGARWRSFVNFYSMGPPTAYRNARWLTPTRTYELGVAWHELGTQPLRDESALPPLTAPSNRSRRTRR